MFVVADIAELKKLFSALAGQVMQRIKSGRRGNQDG
jgi:hypothetical protein